MEYDRDAHKRAVARMAMNEIKFQDWRLTVFWIAVAAGAAIAGFVFGWQWRDRPGALANVSLLNAMTAFGTVGAACGAVGIAYWQHRTNQRERLIRAVHEAAGAYLQLAAMASELDELVPRLEKAGAFGTSMRVFEDIRNRLQAIRSFYVLPEPSSLGPLDGNCGPKLASALGQLRLVDKMLERARVHFTGSTDDPDSRKKDLEFVVGTLVPVVLLLQRVSTECQKVALAVDSPYS